MAPSEDMIKVFNSGFKSDCTLTESESSLSREIELLYCSDPRTRLTKNNYTIVLSHCVQLADCGEEMGMKSFDLLNQRLEPLRTSANVYKIKVNHNTKLPPDLGENDLVLLRVMEYKYDRAIEGVIFKIQSDCLMVKIKEPAHIHDNRVNIKEHISREERLARKARAYKSILKYVRDAVELGAQFDVRFKQTRVPTKMENNALKIFKELQLSEFMFPNSVPDIEVTKNSFMWFNENIATNPEQMQAVKYIVNGTSHPSPYIIFGPPGTGKTSTIVETICQLCTVLPKSKILVTAQSNAACNEISERLLKYLSKDEMYRMFSKSKESNVRKTVNDKLMKVSNMEHRKHEYPTWDELYKYRVVICTLCTSGSLQLAGIDPTHFTHLFIDECASATEPSSLISIAGIMTSKKRINGNIILAGDIKQLGPVVRFKMADNLGYGKSLMERLMELPVYQKNPSTHRYNKRMITKLVYNFRSHSKIIELSNKAFYDNDLIAKASSESTDWALNWCHLPNKQFPIVFHPTYEDHCKEKTSLYNPYEIEIIEKYIKMILTFGINNKAVLQSEIGVISPYKRQTQKLNMRFNDHEWRDIEVGTVEAFQGREKPIMFISTVRSNTDNVGFLNNPKRLNVSLTRAKALMIIVGNPNTLRNDREWHNLLKYCQDNGGCTRPIDIGPRPPASMEIFNSMNDVHAEFRKMFSEIKEKLSLEDFM